MRLIDADALVGGTYYVSQNDRFVGYTQQDIDDTPTVKLCENVVSREAVLNGLANIAKAKAKSDAQKALMGRVMFFTEQLPSVTPQASEEDIHREREQAYMLGYEDASKKFRTEPCEDAVSRQAVFDVINFEDEWLFDAKSYNADTKIAFSAIKSKISELPSVTPERPKGKWIEDTQTGFKIRCSECGARNFGADRAYCPRCGRQMKEDSDD